MGIRNIFSVFSRTPSEPEVVETVRYVQRASYKQPKTPKVDKSFSGLLRGFDGAKGGDLNADWFAPSASINGILKGQIDILRARCRERVRNDDYAKGFSRTFCANVVGPLGIRIQSLVRQADGTADQQAIDAIESAWNSWAKDKREVDVGGRNNWRSMLNLISSVYVSDGEVFIRKVIGKSAGKYGMKLQIIDPEQCDSALNIDLPGGNTIIMGIEVDGWYKPIAYHFKSNMNTHSHLVIPADEIIHLYVEEFPNQVRGIPPLSVSLTRLRMLGGYEEAALTNARISAAKMGFYYREGDDIDPANAIDADGELVEELTPGQFSVLPAGYRFDAFDSKYPDGEIAVFKKSILRAVAAGIGIDYPTLGQDLEAVNLSSARVAINETRELWKGVQQWVIDNVVVDIFEAWLMQSLLRGMITTGPGKLNIQNIEKYKAATWLARRWAWPDPKKDSDTSIALINNRIKSISTVAADLGIDFETEIQRIARDEDLLVQFGLTRIVAPAPEPPEIEEPEEATPSDNV